jgi:hypothetical protein
MKKLFLIFLALLIISSVSASEEAEWLIDRSDEGIWNSMRETAFGILALNKEGGYEDFVINGSKTLITQLRTCMVGNSCNVKDAAIATLALNEVGSNAIIVEDASTWLLNSRSNVFTGELPTASNRWYVQIVSEVGGACVLTNTETGESVNVPVDVSQGYPPWFTVTDEVLTTTTEDLNLDCSSLGEDVVLSLINKKPDANGIENFYIKREEHDKNNISVSFGNACWGQRYRSGNCDRETTGHVLHILNEVEKPGDPSWMIEQTDLNSLNTAFLYRVTNEVKYFESLIDEKNSYGFWGNGDLRSTALIYSLLSPDPIVNGVENWVNSRRDSAGCWPKSNCNVEQTALVLYSESFSVSEPGCPDLDFDGICNEDDNDKDGDGLLNEIDPFPSNPDSNSDGNLDGEEDLDGDGLANKEDNDIDGDGVLNDQDRDPFDASIGKINDDDPGPIIIGAICTTSERCEGSRDALGRCIDIGGDGCPEEDSRDCTSGDFCVTSEGCVGEYSVSCRCIANPGCESTPTDGDTPPSTPTQDVSDDASSVVLWSLLVLLLLIALGGGGFLAYKKGLLKFKFGKKKPEARYTPRWSPQKEKKYVPKLGPRIARKVPKIAKGIESELDQSMKDLEKLLGKK